jgi:DNA-binding LacI/PurR family transcriptional regulator
MDGGVKKTGVTSSQVAQRAGVSQSAVSRSFTPGASISPETRAKVLAAAKELGYRPNAIARSLITNRSRIVAVVMAYLDNLFYPDVLEQLGRLLAKEDYRLLLFTGLAGGDSDPVFDQLMQYRVDGIVLASTSLSSELSEECAAAGIPVVLFNRTTERDAVSSVTTHNREGGRRVAGASATLQGSKVPPPTAIASPATAKSSARPVTRASSWKSEITTAPGHRRRPANCFRDPTAPTRSLWQTTTWPSR